MSEHYTAGAFDGMPNYECAYCAFAATDEDRTREHIQSRHRNVTAVAKHPVAGPLAGIDFASDRGNELASELGLTREHMEGVDPTGATGYTVADVRRAAALRDTPRED